ncbi:FAGL163Wp [Eremothecium gossypii FDAG1]|nr:FAGL163Wp [Eremothecium gossypii FDAG1]
MGADERFDNLLSRLDQVGFDFEQEFDKLALLRQKAFDALSDHDTRKKRLQIELRLRQKYRRYRQNAAYFAKGRFDKVDMDYLNSVIMSNDQLRAACHIHGIHMAQKGSSASVEDYACIANLREDKKGVGSAILEPTERYEPTQPSDDAMSADNTLLYEKKMGKKSPCPLNGASTVESTAAAGLQLPPASLPAKPRSPALSLKRKLCPSSDNSGGGKAKRRVNTSHSTIQSDMSDAKMPRIPDNQLELPDYQHLPSSSFHYNLGHNSLPANFHFPDVNDPLLRNMQFSNPQMNFHSYSNMNLVPVLVPADALAQVKSMGQPSNVVQRMTENSNQHVESIAAAEKNPQTSGPSSGNRHPETSKKNTKRSKAHALPHGTSIEKLLKPPAPKALKKMQKMARKYNL